MLYYITLHVERMKEERISKKALYCTTMLRGKEENDDQEEHG